MMHRYIVYVWRSLVLIVKNLLESLRLKMDGREDKNRKRGYFWCKQSLGGKWATISENQFNFEVVSGGLTNYLYKCSLPHGMDVGDNEPNTVLLRIYGDIAKDQEFLVRNTAVFAILSTKNLGPKLYAVNSEGRIEEFIPTRALKTRELQDPSLSAQIAKKIALFHQIADMPLHKEPRFLEEKIYGWLDETEHVFSRIQSEKNPIVKKLLSKAKSFNLREEAGFLMELLVNCNSPVVFSHNDLQEGNILYMGEAKNPERRMTFIDWEYCSYNYRGFDFGNHFCEWTFDYNYPEYPYYEYSPLNYPSKQQQNTFFRNYLSETDAEPSEETLSFMRKEASTFALASHFFWALWSIMQRELSDIEFGYLDYAICRFEAYFSGKEKLDEA